MKIVYICNEINLKSGWGVLNYHIIKEASKKYDVYVFTLKNANNIQIDNVNIYKILYSMQDSKLKKIKVLFDIYRIKNIINIDDINIVHVLVEPLIPIIKYFTNSKKIITLVGTYSVYSFRNGINASLYKESLKYVDQINAISKYTKEKFLEVVNYDKDIKVIPLGVDYNYFNNKDINVNKELSFVFVGHIKPRKGLIYALAAFSILVQTYKDLKFYIAGAISFNRYEKRCKEFIIDNKLNDNVIFLGKVSDDDLIYLYKKSICNILTSINEHNTFEGFGLIHLEANACGIPTLGSKNCGNESAIIDGKTGFLCEQKNVKDIKEKMEIIIQDFLSFNFDKWEKNCKTYAQQMNWNNYFNRLIKLYKEE